MSTLITNIAELMTQDLEHRVLKDAAVVIEGERISWIGAAADAPAADDAVDLGGRAVRFDDRPVHAFTLTEDVEYVKPKPRVY